MGFYCPGMLPDQQTVFLDGTYLNLCMLDAQLWHSLIYHILNLFSVQLGHGCSFSFGWIQGGTLSMSSWAAPIETAALNSCPDRALLAQVATMIHVANHYPPKPYTTTTSAGYFVPNHTLVLPYLSFASISWSLVCRLSPCRTVLILHLWLLGFLCCSFISISLPFPPPSLSLVSPQLGRRECLVFCLWLPVFPTPP